MITIKEFLNKYKTLYVSRPVAIESAENIREWALAQGFDKTLNPIDMHVTLAFSKDQVDWSNWEKEKDDLLVSSGKRTVEPLGDKGAVVLKIQSNELTRRWKDFVDAGASWDWPSYQPHITITYQGSDVDLNKVEPYSGDITLNGEKWAEVQMDWDKNIKEE